MKGILSELTLITNIRDIVNSFYAKKLLKLKKKVTLPQGFKTTSCRPTDSTDLSMTVTCRLEKYPYILTHTLLFYFLKQEIVESLNNLKSHNEQIYNLYQNLVNTTKNKITEYIERIKEHKEKQNQLEKYFFWLKERSCCLRIYQSKKIFTVTFYHL